MAKENAADLSIQLPLAPVYLLHGTQDYLIQLMKNKLIKEALSSEERDFNLSVYDMTEVALKVALEDAETIPFFGERKVVVLENAFFLTSEKIKSKVEQDSRALENYLSQPAPDAVLILLAPYEKLDKRKKIVKVLQTKAKVHELSKVSDSTIFQLMENVARQFGASYTREAHEQLIVSVGTNLGQLAHEVEKCALYCGTDRPIDRETVLTVGSKSIESNVFLLVNEVMKKNTAESLRLLHDLVRMKEEPLKLLALLERQFRIVYQVGYYQKAGYTQGSMASKIGIHPFAVRMAADQARQYSPQMLTRALSRCAEADYRIKTGAVDKLLALELLIHQIACSE
ncbi:DNA polymerase III subunit delta [Sporolactobacillus spathodeae]|uniref:DNA polymerase III subunit delta n=1 Tax=Sporolactobacillus spathodeae TaxID=1465502 RepID=A0ABS2Q6T1_9BACL|nr:DNA polymerase III subunit delta [Sporolactobacillus spathodeae]MBM7657361.1 DNA polymerase-3 subunit delta [Sporolactobacillus spathodeae]